MNYGVALATIAALVLSMTAALPAFASSEADVDVDNDVKITISNNGVVLNSTTAESDTGGNWAGGSYGGNGAYGGNAGSGGDADAEADADYGDADAEANGGEGGYGGNGGNGGNGGLGGTVQTGDAEANAGTENVVNVNDISVEGCGCNDVDLDDLEDFYDVDVNVDNEIELDVENNGAVLNATHAYARTGWNAADGSYGGNGDDAGNGSSGGDADADADSSDEGDADADANGGYGGMGGNGGEGGEGGEGGLVVTGEARSNSGTINIVNSNLVRIVR